MAKNDAKKCRLRRLVDRRHGMLSVKTIVHYNVQDLGFPMVPRLWP